jgi:hypothetical protein
MLESQGNIPDAEVIEITAPAFGNIADVRRRKDKRFIGIA